MGKIIVCLKKYHILPITGVLIILERYHLYPPRCKDRPPQRGYLPNPPRFLADLISGMHLKYSVLNHHPRLQHLRNVFYLPRQNNPWEMCRLLLTLLSMTTTSVSNSNGVTGKVRMI